MERVTPVRHLVDMETFMSVLIGLSAVIAAVIFVVAGVYSVIALLWGDLLESEPVTTKAAGGDCTEAA